MLGIPTPLAESLATLLAFDGVLLTLEEGAGGRPLSSMLARLLLAPEDDGRLEAESGFFP